MKIFFRLFIIGLMLAMQGMGRAAAPAGTAGTVPVEQWGIFEVALKGPAAGNPFVDVTLSAQFTLAAQVVEAAGFYDGDGTYRVRFMPPAQGTWRYKTQSNVPELNGKTGEFLAGKPGAGNHGPVGVRNTYHFGYADGTAYFPFGTTCYAWAHQGDVLEEQTLATLKASPFNKIRMCIFPKHYTYNTNEPVYYPFEGKAPKTWDFTRFNPEFFRHMEKRIGELRDLGIEADLILFHPYDKGTWGFDAMPPAVDDAYLRYLTARLSAYRNVWWSLANEFDFMREKKDSDWDRFFHIIEKSDPYGHLRSIHNGSRIYNNTQPWVMHASIQNGEALEDVGRAVLYRAMYDKPIVFDEAKYEGNIEQRWGNLSAQEMTHRFWVGTVSGVYVGHGETYLDPKEVIWWSKGGTLHGESPARIAFLRKVVEGGAGRGLNPIDTWEDPRVAGRGGQYYLLYFGKETPTEWKFELPKPGMMEGQRYQVEVLDTWAMTITPAPDTYTATASGKYRFKATNDAVVKLPGKPYMALRITRVTN